MHAKIAPKKSVTAAREDLQIALDEKICEPQKLLELFDCDEQVALPASRKAVGSGNTGRVLECADGQGASAVLDVLQTALDEDLIDVKKLIAAIGVDRLLADLPKELLEKSLSDAIRLGLEGKPFDYVRLPVQLSALGVGAVRGAGSFVAASRGR